MFENFHIILGFSWIVHIKSYWAKHKLVLKKMKGCRREFLTEYLQEFMWRDKFEAGQSTFEALCGHIALIHRI